MLLLSERWSVFTERFFHSHFLVDEVLKSATSCQFKADSILPPTNRFFYFQIEYIFSLPTLGEYWHATDAPSRFISYSNVVNHFLIMSIPMACAFFRPWMGKLCKNYPARRCIVLFPNLLSKPKFFILMNEKALKTSDHMMLIEMTSSYGIVFGVGALLVLGFLLCIFIRRQRAQKTRKAREEYQPLIDDKHTSRDSW